MISIAQLQNKYNIKLDTLLVDCEGALYCILRGDPDILENINLSMMGNDFEKQEQIDYAQKLFKENEFKACIAAKVLNFKLFT